MDLSVNNIDRQVYFPKRDDCGGEMVECEERVFELLVAHQQLAEPVEPAMTSLHNPAARFLLWITLFVLGLAFATHHMRDIAVGQDDLHGVLAPIASIST